MTEVTADESLDASPTSTRSSEVIIDEMLCVASIDELYKLATTYYREKNGSRALCLAYADRNEMVALAKQVRIGDFDPAKVEVGFLDLIGGDRNKAWRDLRGTDTATAKRLFVKKLLEVSPHFEGYASATRTCSPALTNGGDAMNHTGSNPSPSPSLPLAEQQHPQQTQQAAVVPPEMMQTPQMQAVIAQEANVRRYLNNAAEKQFQQYVEGVFPHDVAKQRDLMQGLQEQHYQQYITQLAHHYHQQQQQMQHGGSVPATPEHSTGATAITPGGPPIINIVDATPPNNVNSTTAGALATSMTQMTLESGIASSHSDSAVSQHQMNGGDGTAASGAQTLSHDTRLTASENDVSNTRDDADEVDEDEIMLDPVTLWVSEDIKPFKATISKEAKDTILRIGSGETVTIKVPTHQDASMLYWEFATDSYDLAFGVFFEWCTPADKMQIEVEEDEGDEEEDDDGDADAHSKNDSENAGGRTGTPAKRRSSKLKVLEGGNADDAEAKQLMEGGEEEAEASSSPLDELVPILRRDCHLKVQCGSHRYPAAGNYLLKFDNSFSLWRSKTLYYRVYYSQ